MARATAPLAALLLFALPGCDAGNREAPGSDNALGSPSVRITAPYEKQAVVVSRPGAPVMALFDLSGANLGRGKGSTLRYKLDAPEKPGEWVTVADATKPVELGVLAPTPGTQDEQMYVLTAEVLDAEGKPWTRAEPASVVHPSATAVRRFRVHAGWETRKD
jgi:hypothetical protein